MVLSEFFLKAWKRYLHLTPDAQKALALLESRGEKVVNDHIALRTFNIPGIDRKSLGHTFEKWGYRAAEDLVFEEKKLLATYYLHPDPMLPKIFISELLLEKFPTELQLWLKRISSMALNEKELSEEFFLRPSWDPIRFEDYERFYPISEYAAWTAAFGIQVNHFTVSVNSLKTFQSLQELNEFLLNHGFVLNAAGGLIKGTPAELLEQSSTLAKKIPWKFSDGLERRIMGCYYEFAKRYVVPGSNSLFQGFIPKSADKIFESTFEKPSK